MKGQDKVQKSDNKGKVLVTCLDNSGSMNGRPMESVKIGCSTLGESLLGDDESERPFEHFITMVYNTYVNDQKHESLNSYNNYVKDIRAGGTTNFVRVFEKIESLFRSYQISELTVIFFTDGQDTCNKAVAVQDSFKQLSNKLKNNKDVKSRFLSIGFSKDHDATFMNNIA